jgi:TatD DNase family protein
MFIDTHAHLNFPDFERDYREIFDRAKEKDVIKIINVGTDLTTSKRAIELSGLLPGAFPTVGLHPHDAKQWGGKEIMEEFDALARDKQVIAIGEVGLDFYRPNYDKEQQVAVFSAFLDIAEAAEKPIIIHCRSAYEDLLGFLKERKGLGAVVHAFEGDPETAKQFLDLGLYLSFACNVTYPKNYSRYSSLLPSIPLDRLLLETDCPFLPPEGERGNRNEPKNVIYVAETIGEILKKDPEEIGEITTRNARQLFSI